jgi:hypothetical protein
VAAVTAPTILVDFGYDLGAPGTSAYFHVGDPVNGKIGVGAIGPERLLTAFPIADRVLDFEVHRTSSRVVGPVVTYDAGTASLTLINDDGALDPFVMAESAVMSVLRIRAQLGSTIYPVFRGFVTSWVPEHRYPTFAVVNVTAVDGFKILAEYLRTATAPAGAGEDAGARIDRILDSVNWSLADRDIAVGDSTLAATTNEGDALAEAQDVMTAEAGEFYVDESGRMFFRNRHALLTDARSTTSQATFGSNTGGGELPYVGVPGLSDDDEQTVNLISATRTGGAEQVVEDAASRARYLDHKHEQTDMKLQADSNVRDWAGYILHFDHLPEFRFTSLELDPRVDETDLYPQVLGRRIGDRITVVRRPPAAPWGTVVDSKQVYIRSIEHSWSRPNKWTTSWGLQPVDKLSFFIVGHAVNGRIGQNAIAY